MAVDKSKIKPILEGQTGNVVATNLKSNFDFLADEIDKNAEAQQLKDGTQDKAIQANVTQITVLESKTTEQDSWIAKQNKWSALNNPPQWFKDALVCYYNPKKQGLTNEQIKAAVGSGGKGYFELEDFSPNNLHMKMYGFNGEGMSGMNGYGINVLGFQPNIGNLWKLETKHNTIKAVCIKDNHIPPFYFQKSVGEVYSSKISMKLNIEKGDYELQFDVSSNKGENLKVDLINGKSVDINLPDNIFNDMTASSPGISLKRGEFKTGDSFILECTSSYPNALVFDGVDDYGEIDNFPLLTKDKGYTILMEREVVPQGGTQSAVLSNKSAASSDWGAFTFEREYLTYFVTYSYGRNTTISINNNKSVVYQTSKTYNGKYNLIAGNDKPSKNLYLGTFDSKQGFFKISVWKVLIFNRDLTLDEINWVRWNIMGVSDGGRCRELYEAAGAVFNDNTGYYELNGLTDITEKEMACIYVVCNAVRGGRYRDNVYRSTRIRTTLVDNYSTTFISASNYISLGASFYGCQELEIIKLTPEISFKYPMYATGTNIFGRCPKLRKIESAFHVDNNYNNFTNCPSLESVYLVGLDIDISFNSSPLLDVRDIISTSLGCMIEYAANKDPITITLHHDAFVRVPQTLIDKATAKNISIADASATA